MTAFALQPNVTPRQREVAQVVVKRGILPTCWVMAGGAISAVFAAVFIVLLMAGITV